MFLRSSALAALAIGLMCGSSWGAALLEPAQTCEDASACASFEGAGFVRLIQSDFDQDAWPVERVSSWGVEVHSNDSYLVWFNLDPESPTGLNQSVWDTARSGVFLEIMSTMEDEGFWSMSGRYPDASVYAGYPDLIPSTHTLSVSGQDSNRSVVFEHNAIYGLMPGTYRFLEMVAAYDVMVELSVSEESPLSFVVSCTVTNNEDEEVTFAAVLPSVWPLFVVRDNGCTYVQKPTILPTNIWTIGAHEEVVFSAKPVDASSFPDGTYRLVSEFGGVVGMCDMMVEGNDDYVNTPPKFRGASSEQDPSGAWVLEVIGCCDMEDRVEDLTVRWDWESDGVWDTDWSQNKSCSHRFESPGLAEIAYELMDTDGAAVIGSTTLTVSGTETESPHLYVAAIVVVAAVVALVVVAVFLLLRRRGGPGVGQGS